MEQNQYLDDVVIEDVYKIEQPKAGKCLYFV